MVKLSENRPQPGVKMKQMNWSKIPDFKVRDTIFADMISGQENVEIEVNELEVLFAAAPVVVPEVHEAKKKLKMVNLIDSKKSQLINIFLGSHRLSFDGVRDMLYAMDPRVMTIDLSEQLSNVAPTAEELVKVNEYKKKNFDMQRLGNPERMMMAVSVVPLIQDRLFANLMRLQFQSRVEQLKPKVELLRSACRQMRESPLWKRLLETVLALGNFLNAKSGRGNAIGIRLESLLKISDTRAVDKKTTMLTYLVQLLEKKDVPVLSFSGELSSIPLVSRLDMSMMSLEVRQLSDMISRHKKALAKVPAELNPKDHLLDVLNDSALELYSTLLDSVKSDLQTAFLDWAALARVYGEDEKQMTSTDFFGLVVKFIDQFDAARKAVVQQRIRDQQVLAQKAAKAAAKERADRELERNKALQGPNATLNVLEVVAEGEDGVATELGARDTALLMEAALKMRNESPKVQRSHAGPPTSAMLADLRKGLKSGSAFADKRAERKKSLRNGRLPDDMLPSWAGKRRDLSPNSSGGTSAPGSPQIAGGRRKSFVMTDLPKITAKAALNRARGATAVSQSQPNSKEPSPRSGSEPNSGSSSGRQSERDVIK